MHRMMYINFQESDYRGRVYRRFYAERNSSGPGWIISGVCHPDVGEHTYGGCVVMLVAEPRMGEGEFKNWRKRRSGFRLMRDANAVAGVLNGMFDAEPILPPCALRQRMEIAI